jgi:toxin CptA
MHNAPSVTYPVGRSRLAALLLAGVWLAGAAALGAWAAQDAGPPWRTALASALLALTGCNAWLAWWRSPVGELGWDATAWRWTPAGSAAEPAQVACVLDLQAALLLRTSCQGRTRWLWARRAALPARWPDLRRAVYSRATPDALPGAPPPTAKP